MSFFARAADTTYRNYSFSSRHVSARLRHIRVTESNAVDSRAPAYVISLISTNRSLIPSILISDIHTFSSFERRALSLCTIFAHFIIDHIMGECTETPCFASVSRGTHGTPPLRPSRTTLNGLRVVRRRVKVIGGSTRRRVAIGRSARPTSGAV